MVAVGMEEGSKDNAASNPNSRITNQSIRAFLPMRVLQILLLFLVLTLGISVVSIHMIKFLRFQHLGPEAQTTLISMYDHGTVTLESFIRPPSNVWHTMNDTELLWRASAEPRRDRYPFKLQREEESKVKKKKQMEEEADERRREEEEEKEKRKKKQTL